MGAIFFINIYSQSVYLSFEKDYNVFQRNSSYFNGMFQSQSIFFIEYTQNDLGQINSFLAEIRRVYPQMLKTDIYKKNKEVRSAVDIIQKEAEKFTTNYVNFLARIVAFNIVRMTYKEDLLTEEEIKTRNQIFKEVEVYINGAEIISKNLDNIYFILDNKKNEIDKIRSFLLNTVILIGILLSIVVSFIILFSVRKSLINLTRYVARIADGDFTAKIKIKSRDEIQLLAENVKNIISFEETLKSIKKSTATLESSYNKINQAVSDINTIAKNQEKTVGEASESFKKLSLSLNEISDYSIETKNLTLNTRDQTINSSSQIRETISDISMLSEFAERIKGTLKIINTITDETELLSINAAIEAAKAGSAGKGFAVVATEIGKLAETSSSATEEISILAEDILDKIKKTTENTEVSIEALKVIETSIEEVAKEMEEISIITEQKSIQANAIMSEVNKVIEITRESTENANKIVESNKLLKDKVDELHRLVGKFRLSDEE
jgi:methyl-accepting chemotaxis protein